MKKKQYETPSVEVVELKQQSALLAGSGLGNPSDYSGGGDPFNSAREADEVDFFAREADEIDFSEF